MASHHSRLPIRCAYQIRRLSDGASQDRGGPPARGWGRKGSEAQREGNDVTALPSLLPQMGWDGVGCGLLAAGCTGQAKSPRSGNGTDCQSATAGSVVAGGAVVPLDECSYFSGGTAAPLSSEISVRSPAGWLGLLPSTCTCSNFDVALSCAARWWSWFAEPVCQIPFGYGRLNSVRARLSCLPATSSRVAITPDDGPAGLRRWKPVRVRPCC